MAFESLVIGLSIIIAGILSIELGISVAILEIVAGLIVAYYFDISGLTWLDFLSNFGILGIMFIAGFEIDKDVLKRHYRRSLAIGLSAYFTPLIIISLISYLIFGLGMRASLLIGLATSTTSLALVYPALKEKHLLKVKTGHILLSSAMIVDLLSIVSLTILLGLVDVSMAIYVLAALALLLMAPRIGHWLFSKYKGNIVELEMKFILFVLLSLAVISERVYASEVIFVFMAGLFFSALLKQHAALEDKLRGIIFGFMAPLFFFKAGTMIDVKIIDLDILIATLTLFALAFLGKFVGTYSIVKKVCRPKFASFAGLLFNYRLTFGIIASVFGLRYGIIDEGIYFALMGTILLTSIISSILLRKFQHVTPTELE